MLTNTLSSRKLLIFSELHANTLLNPNNGFVTPQFCVLMEELISTVANTPLVTHLASSLWPVLCYLQFCYYFEDGNPAPHIHTDCLIADEMLFDRK